MGREKNLITAIANLYNVDETMFQCQAIILCPTRELAQQVHKVIACVGVFMNIKCHTCLAGIMIKEDIQILREGVHVIVSTPGRLETLVKRETIKLDALKIIIIDEADDLLSRGFTDQIDSLHQFLPPKVQSVIFSSIKTTEPELASLITKYCNDPVHINLDAPRESLEGIKQFHITVEHKDMKFNALLKFIKDVQVTQAIIFCRSIENVNLVAKQLASEFEYSVSKVYENMQQHEQDEAWKSYHSGSTRILVTDSENSVSQSSRKVSSVALIINYDLPHDVEKYILLSGRGGRFGRKAVVINLLVPAEHDMKRAIEEYYSTTILPLPEDAADRI